MGSCLGAKACKWECLDKKPFMLGVKKTEREREGERKRKKKIKERVVKYSEGAGFISEIKEV